MTPDAGRTYVTQLVITRSAARAILARQKRMAGFKHAPALFAITERAAQFCGLCSLYVTLHNHDSHRNRRKCNKQEGQRVQPIAGYVFMGSHISQYTTGADTFGMMRVCIILGSNSQS